MNNQNTTLVDLVITLTPEILRTDLHTGRRFEDPAVRDHAYGRRLIDATITQLCLEGLKYIGVTPSGFVMRWKGDVSVEKGKLDKFATGLRHIAQEVHRIKPEQEKGISLKMLRRLYGDAYMKSAYERTKKPL